jgi:xanthine dehydrogenase accessory factor
MFNNFLKTTSDLYDSKEAFALAFVVNRTNPSSGKPGDKAIIQQDGKIIGWIGGGCTRGIILKEAATAMQDGKPRLVRISPEGEASNDENVKEYRMTCHSGGSVEVYIEPVLPRPQILIMGRSHVAMALSRISKAMDYTINVFAAGADEVAFPDADGVFQTELNPEVITPNTCIVVCTQGENDEKALEQALNSGASYVSFIASRKKANAVFANLRGMGLKMDQLKKIKTPAGLDINAKLPEEVAISILAEIIAFIRKEDKVEAMPQVTPMAGNADIFINPVCDVPVQKSTAKHVIEYKGKNVYFCCDGCKVTFEKDPEKYASKLEAVAT